jgi:hypothetical protein
MRTSRFVGSPPFGQVPMGADIDSDFATWQAPALGQAPPAARAPQRRASDALVASVVWRA